MDFAVSGISAGSIDICVVVRNLFDFSIDLKVFFVTTAGGGSEGHDDPLSLAVVGDVG